MSNSSVFKSRLNVLRSSADLQLYDSEFQTEGALKQNAFADNVSGIRGTASNSFMFVISQTARKSNQNQQFAMQDNIVQ